MTVVVVLNYVVGNDVPIHLLITGSLGITVLINLSSLILLLLFEMGIIIVIYDLIISSMIGFKCSDLNFRTSLTRYLLFWKLHLLILYKSFHFDINIMTNIL